MQNETWFIRQLPTTTLSWGGTASVPHQCPHCHIDLLTGEKPGFCCGKKGSRLNNVPPLPPLPPEYNIFINDPRISSLSRIVNLIFAFASLETTHPFPENTGPPGFFAIQGKIYHRIRPTHKNSAVRWLLYDGFLTNVPHNELAKSIPNNWISALKSALLRINPFVRSLQVLSHRLLQFPEAQLTLYDNITVPEIAALISFDNTTLRQAKPRELIIKPTIGTHQYIPTTSTFWEPLAYPLLFPNATRGWGLTTSDSLDDTHGQNIPTTQMWYYRARLLREPRFRMFGRLTNEYIVDMFTRDLECRLNYIRTNQNRL
jgi:hypothetical protein